MAIIDLANLPNKTAGTLTGTEQIFLNDSGVAKDVTIDELSDYSSNKGTLVTGKVLKLRTGSTVSHSAFTGAQGEITVDTTKNVVVVHDGIKAGGFPLTKAEDLSEPSGASLMGANAHQTQDGVNLQHASVKRFGAVGDGVTDDTLAINLAIAYAKVTSTKCIVFPSGNYKTSASIVLGGNYGTGIELHGYQATITCTANTPIIDINCRVPDSPPQVRMNAYVHGFTLVGPGKANTSTRGIKAQRGAGVKVENCSITDVYIGLHGYGNLISHYSDVNIYGTFMPLQFEPDGIEFAPNDLHFTRIKAFDNDRACRMINFPNGAMTFTGCELEGNNSTGSITDGVRVAEFFNAGKVTMIGCHMEANPGQYNLFFDGNNGAHLNVIGSDFIPGDNCGNVLYVDNSTGSPNIYVEGGRVTNNIPGHQIVLSTGVKAVVIGQTAGAISGDLSKTVVLQNGLVSIGRPDSLAGGAGVAFPITQLPSTDPNTLDDYEEGVWAPIVTGQSTTGTATYATQNGRYTKIGRQVFVECFVNWSAGTGAGDFSIAGLPFTVGNLPATYPAAIIGRTNAFSWTAGSIPCANFEPGTTRIAFFQQPSGGGVPSPIPYDAAAYVMVSGTYTV